MFRGDNMRKLCELCGVDIATTEVEYHDINWECCEDCKRLAERME